MELDRSIPMITLAGNPNVGKSTVFNALTGMHQHTGNWPGKTVSHAVGEYQWQGRRFYLTDLPGAYSLYPHSAEEEATKNYLFNERNDCVIIVCDATCLERNLNFVLQVLEITSKAIVCLNLMDEAKRKGICIDITKLSRLLGVPVIPVIARKKTGLRKLMQEAASAADSADQEPYHIPYPPAIEKALSLIMAAYPSTHKHISPRKIALHMLESGQSNNSALDEAKEILERAGYHGSTLTDALVAAPVNAATAIYKETVRIQKTDYIAKDRRLDRLLTGRTGAYPTMLLLLALVFWITLSGANYPSRLLSDLLMSAREPLLAFCADIGISTWLSSMLIEGVYRVTAWVISVMLPPMAIFFPLFTLLEDAGYLPRVAFNLDRHFQRCRACGKQALTMMMGFGCNAAGVTGCRIIDSPRERLIAILTNSFVPCNGRFPTLIALMTIFFTGMTGGVFGSIKAALLLTAVIVFSVIMTFAASRFLSVTVLKGIPSSFTLELPPYRRPQIIKTLARSLRDRTLFVLMRAVKAAAPAGLLIWLMANVRAGDASLLAHASGFLDPFGKLLGMDGTILLAFILGLPANEIILPIIIMGYTCGGTLNAMESIDSLAHLLTANGWTWCTACCTMIFFLMHWPCATTIMTIHKETGSMRWTIAAIILPALWGMLLCVAVAGLYRFFC